MYRPVQLLPESTLRSFPFYSRSFGSICDPYLSSPPAKQALLDCLPFCICLLGHLTWTESLHRWPFLPFLLHLAGCCLLVHTCLWRVHLCRHVCSKVCVLCICGWQRPMSDVFLHQYPLNKVSHWIWNLLITLARQQHLSFPCFCLLRLGWQICTFFGGFLWVKLRSSCLLGKHLTAWVISWALATLLLRGFCIVAGVAGLTSTDSGGFV